jgi:hypothetical protein
MGMKKYLFLFMAFLTTFLSCEKDDICVEQNTPSLIIRFYDNDDREQSKQLTNAYIWAVGMDSLSNYINKSLDSIAVPLNLSENVTKYVIEDNAIKDTIEFNYSRKDTFISRSCGYITIFENLAIGNNSTSWIKDTEILNATIENERFTHINIYH